VRELLEVHGRSGSCPLKALSTKGVSRAKSAKATVATICRPCLQVNPDFALQREKIALQRGTFSPFQSVYLESLLTPIKFAG
jgi:hypothetical protein